MRGIVKRWGGSITIRLDPKDARRLGLKEDMPVRVDVKPEDIDFSTLPTVKDRPDAARRHDELLYGSR